MVAYTCNPASQDIRQEDCKFEASPSKASETNKIQTKETKGQGRGSTVRATYVV